MSAQPPKSNSTSLQRSIKSVEQSSRRRPTIPVITGLTTRARVRQRLQRLKPLHPYPAPITFAELDQIKELVVWWVDLYFRTLIEVDAARRVNRDLAARLRNLERRAGK